MAVIITAPPSTTKLIALADLKALLGITDGANDALLGNIIQRGAMPPPDSATVSSLSAPSSRPCPDQGASCSS